MTMTNRARAAAVRNLHIAIRNHGLNDMQAAEWLKVPQARIEALHRGDFEAFSPEELDTMMQAEELLEAAPASLHLVDYERLTPCNPWTGGRITDTDVLTLEEAAQMASKHAGQEITVADFLRAAGRGEIALHAVIQRTAKVRAHDGRIFCNAGQENENIVPAGCIVILPLTACQHLANVRRARWRTFDGFKDANGTRWRYAKGILADKESDFETVPADCRVTGYNVRALADAFCTANDEQQHETAPAETPMQRRARLLAELEAEQAIQSRGALQRLADRHGVDRSNLGKDIQKAKAERAEDRRAGTWANHLVRNGKRTA